MAEYKMSQNINSNKMFFINRSEIEGRLEAEYYAPKINLLEKRIRKKTNKKLRDFILKISSGATPSVEEEEKYYSDEQNGLPFLRVQNLQVNGKLDLTDVKFINKETHAGYLKRSQVAEGDLLVKITGVGRMAIASVAPEGFVGNTNQHMVVIKTGSRAKSEYLAQYLNLDISEKLASRRSTGATRPALDYPALKSLPIVENVDFTILAKAEKQKQQKENEAKALLDSIDIYLLKELGIELPKQDNSLKGRIFTTNIGNIKGRLEPFYYQTYFQKLDECLINGKYTTEKVGKVCDLLNGYAFKSVDYIDFSETVNIRMSNIRPNNNFDADYNIRYLPNNYSELYRHYLLNDGDIIIAMTDMAAEPKILGVPTIVSNSSNRKFLLNQRVGKLYSFDLKKIHIEYLVNILGSKLVKDFYNQQGARGVQINISREQILSARIPLPPLPIQILIADYIQNIRAKAKRLQNEANEVLEKAKADVEKMILG